MPAGLILLPLNLCHETDPLLASVLSASWSWPRSPLELLVPAASCLLDYSRLVHFCLNAADLKLSAADILDASAP